MSHRDDRAYLLDIVERAKFLLKETKDWSLDKLTENRLIASGVVREIQNIGEGAAKLKAETRDAITNVPWKSVVGMRHRLVHAYDEVDWEEVLDVLQNDLAPLIKAVEQYVKDHPISE